MLGKQERGEEGKKSYVFLWGLPISYSSWRFFKEFGSMEGVMLKQNVFLFFFCFIPWGDISPLLFYWSAAACCSLVLGVSMLTKCLSVNFSLGCFLDKLASSVILVVVSSCVFLLDIKSVLSQCLGTPWLALSSSSWSYLLLGTTDVRCPLHLLRRPSYKSVRLPSCSRISSRGDTRLFLREAGILQRSAVVGSTQCHSLLYRNSSVIQCC